MRISPPTTGANVERLMQYVTPEKGAGEVVKMTAIGGRKRR
jgi:hypothetical protein